MNVIFAEANSKVKDELLHVKEKDVEEKGIVFVDLVADNMNTWGVFKTLIDIVIDKEWRNVAIIPIPCMEFCFMQAFESMITDRCDYELMIQRDMYKNSEVYKKGYLRGNERENSFETFCKAIKRSYLPVDACKVSFNINNKSFYNTFVGLRNEPKSMMEKYTKLLGKLPVYPRVGYIKGKEGDIVTSIRREVSEFEKQVMSYMPSEATKCVLSKLLSSVNQYIAFLSD